MDIKIISHTKIKQSLVQQLSPRTTFPQNSLERKRRISHPVKILMGFSRTNGSYTSLRTSKKKKKKRLVAV